MPIMQSISSLRFIITIHLPCIFYLLSSLSYCEACLESCGQVVVPYPFRIDKCGLKEFQLQCNDDAQLVLWLHNTDFKVLFLTAQSVVIDPMRGSACGNANAEYFHFMQNSSYVIPGTSYRISKNNALMMYRCIANSSCGCDIQPGVDGAATIEQIFGCPSRYCCGSLREKGLMSLMKNCSSFISFTFSSQPLHLPSPVDIQVQYGLELEAWIPGPCNCDSNAKCNVSEDCHGYQCHCMEGFLGDGLAMGKGCRANVSSCRRDSFVGCPRNVIILSIGVIAGTIIIVVTVAALLHVQQRKDGIGDVQSRRDIKQIEGLLCNHNVTKVFAYKDLEKATKGFSDHYKLGSGAFGTVYAGKLVDGRLVAVKRINYRYMQGIQQVVNEVKVLTAVKHPNLVQLLGCCLEYGDPLLVYEYVPNGTVCEHLQGVRGTHLPWARRVSIALETAQALTYLHSLDPPIYHRDVKSSNILLDYNFTSKVADFGLSRLVLTDNSHISTVPQGTPGYLDPQYHQSFHLSEKSDVYSFGVVLVEIITAMKVVDFTRKKCDVNLANLAVTRIGNGTLDEVIDPTLEAGRNPQVRTTIQLVAEIAYRCLSYDQDARPTIREVAQELEYVRNEAKKIRLQRHSLEMSRSQSRNPKREGSGRIQSMSSSSTEELYGSQGSSFRA